MHGWPCCVVESSMLIFRNCYEHSTDSSSQPVSGISCYIWRIFKFTSHWAFVLPQNERKCNLLHELQVRVKVSSYIQLWKLILKSRGQIRFVYKDLDFKNLGCASEPLYAVQFRECYHKISDFMAAFLEWQTVTTIRGYRQFDDVQWSSTCEWAHRQIVQSMMGHWNVSSLTGYPNR